MTKVKGEVTERKSDKGQVTEALCPALWSPGLEPKFKHSGSFSKRLNMELPSDTLIPFLGIYPKEMKISVHGKTCTQMCIYNS